MSLIIGKEYCKVDTNGRFKLPIALKRQLDEGDNRFVVRRSIYAECLELWTYSSFQEEVARLRKMLNPFHKEDYRIISKLTEGNIIELDNNDRLLIPAEQKHRIKTAKDIVLQATGNFIEIWDYDTYQKKDDDIADFASLVDNRLGHIDDTQE